MVVERTGFPLECSALSASPLSCHCPQCLPPPGRYVYVCVWRRRNREEREERREGREEGGRGERERKPRHTVIVLHMKMKPPYF